MIGRAGLAALLLVLPGCATKGNVREVATQVAVLRAETARQDSARAAELARIIRLQQTVLDSLSAGRRAVGVLEARLGNDLVDIQRQLLQVQELTGQGQSELRRLRAQFDARAAQAEVEAAARPGDSVLAPGDSVVAPPPMPAASADQMYQGALQQFRRGSVLLARRAFLGFLDTYPEHPLVPDATYYVGETFETEAPDSAIARYNTVLETFPQSKRAPSALYKIGLIAARRNDVATARATFQRVVQEFPRSEEAVLAQERLKSLTPP